MPNQGGTHEQHVKAGQQSHKNDDNKQQHASENKKSDDNHRGGKGNFAEDRERASEAGRKGGQK
ncbi:KGG domain-containing protein [Aquamicrobium ahrensii]|uniref:General stress protein YciG n=1 Tax=Aquamicrobium ahrensii TaxID=469551 RepID=A0ABV2KL44_9HYPH